MINETEKLKETQGQKWKLHAWP